MARSGCCGGGCSCVVMEGAHITVEGSGAPTDPFVISADLELSVQDNTTFNLTLAGTGSTDFPYVIGIDYAPTATVRHLPDWSDAVPTNGQVPVWNSSLGQWVPGTNTPAVTGAVSHNTSLSGDGSSGSPLAVVADTARLLSTTSSGVGLTDVGVNRTLRKFATESARSAASPAPTLNTLSVLDSEPGRVQIWNGTAWEDLEAPGVPVFFGDELLQLSGPWDGTAVQTVVRNGSATTAADGSFAVLDPSDLTDAAGVLNADVTALAPVPFIPMVSGEVPGQVTCFAYAPGSGEPYAGVLLNYSVRAVVYT